MLDLLGNHIVGFPTRRLISTFIVNLNVVFFLTNSKTGFLRSDFLKLVTKTLSL